MKKGIIVFMLVLAFCLSACSKKAPENPNHQTQAGTAAAPETTGETETAVDQNNVSDAEPGEAELSWVTAETEFDYAAYLTQSIAPQYDTICKFLSLPLNDGESFADIKNRLIETEVITADQVMNYGGYGWDFKWTDSEDNTIHVMDVNGVYGFYVVDTPCLNVSRAGVNLVLSEEDTISLFTANTYLYKTIVSSFMLYEEDLLKELLSEIEQFLAEQYPEFNIRFEPDEESPFGETIYMHPENGEAVPLSKVIAFENNYQVLISAPAAFDLNEFDYPYGCFAALSDEEITEELIKIISCIPNSGEPLDDFLLRLNQSTGASLSPEDFNDGGEMHFNYRSNWKAGLIRLYIGSLNTAGEGLRFLELEPLEYDGVNQISVDVIFQDPKRASVVFADLREYFEKLYGKERLIVEESELCKVLSYDRNDPLLRLDYYETGVGHLTVKDFYSRFHKPRPDSQLSGNSGE